MKNKLKITFDRKSASFILEAFENKFPNVCIFCNKTINEKNLSGIISKGMFCSNIVCIVQLSDQIHEKQT